VHAEKLPASSLHSNDATPEVASVPWNVKVALVLLVGVPGLVSMIVSGATVSIFTATGIAVEPTAAPVLPGVSVAVQLIECVPSPVMLNVLEAVVAVPAFSALSVIPLSVSVHVIAVTSEGSDAETVPVTGAVLYQPLLPFAEASNVIVTTGGVVSGAFTITFVVTAAE